MIYNNLILNKHIFNKLTSFYNKDHLPTAFIFHGNEGIGKEAHALEFFALMNCDKNNASEACGICKSCNKVKKLQHELLNIIVPLPKTKSINKNSNPLNALSNKEQSELINQFLEKGENPYHKISLDKANTIIINSIKNINNNSSMSVTEGRIKLHLIFEADKLCYPKQESANALLKMLEEPKENNLFILVTSDINKIIDTILSRCVPIFFKDLSSNDIEKIIAENTENSKKITIIAKLCQGNVKKAKELINSFDEKMNILHSMINSITNNDISLWNSQFKRKNKIYIQDNLDLLVFFFRDLDFIQHNNISDIHFPKFSNLYNDYNNQNKKINWNNCIKSITNAQNYLNRNGYPPLVSAALFIEIQNIIQSEKLHANFELNEWIA